MGLTFSNFLRCIFEKKQLRIIMVGLDAAGKTTILYKLQLNEVVPTIPTIGFNVEMFDFKGTTFTVWDVGGQDKIRRLWRHYYQNTQGIMFVVDSTDRDRIAIAKDELHSLLKQPELKNSCLLVCANKQDIQNAMDCSEVAEKLALIDVKSHSWRILPTCAIDGSGVYEGLEWLAAEIK